MAQPVSRYGLFSFGGHICLSDAKARENMSRKLRTYNS
jgi:hypothetical protein